MIQLVLHTKLSSKLDDDENLSSEEETCFTSEVTKAIYETLHKKKRRRAYQSSFPDILPYRKKAETKVSDFIFNDNPKRLRFENTFLSWMEDRYIMDLKLFGKSLHPYSLLGWLEFNIDWTNAIYAKGIIFAPNKPISNKPLNNSRNHAYIFRDGTRINGK